jgi:hypothetical protein
MKLYNVTVRAVDLVWAESEEDAIRILSGRVANETGAEILPDGAEAFVSEPSEEHGWTGEES